MAANSMYLLSLLTTIPYYNTIAFAKIEIFSWFWRKRRTVGWNWWIWLHGQKNWNSWIGRWRKKSRSLSPFMDGEELEKRIWFERHLKADSVFRTQAFTTVPERSSWKVFMIRSGKRDWLVNMILLRTGSKLSICWRLWLIRIKRMKKRSFFLMRSPGWIRCYVYRRR